MKSILFILSFIFIVFSCSSPSNSSTDYDTELEEGSDSLELVMEESSRNSITKQLSGFWMSDSYLNELTLNKSVFKSRNYTSTWFGITFDPNSLMSDNPGLAGISDHEGGYDCAIWFNEENKRFESIQNDPKVENPFKTPFYITPNDSDRIEIIAVDGSKRESYRRVADIQTAIREALIAGNYVKGSNEHLKVVFSKDGSVRGFEPYLYYDIVFDFGEGIAYDVIFLSKSSQENYYTDGKAFTYRFSNKALILNPLITNWETFEHQKSDSILVLMRQGS